MGDKISFKGKLMALYRQLNFLCFPKDLENFIKNNKRMINEALK